MPFTLISDSGSGRNNAKICHDMCSDVGLSNKTMMTQSQYSTLRFYCLHFSYNCDYHCLYLRVLKCSAPYFDHKEQFKNASTFTC